MTPIELLSEEEKVQIKANPTAYRPVAELRLRFDDAVTLSVFAVSAEFAREFPQRLVDAANGIRPFVLYDSVVFDGKLEVFGIDLRKVVAFCIVSDDVQFPEGL